MKFTSLLLTVVLVSACKFPAGPTIINNISNTNTNIIDLHDLINFSPAANPTTPVPVPPPVGGTEVPLPLPAGAQAIAQQYATANPSLIAQSCQAVYGEPAWRFMDGLVGTLKASDPRWGYMVKTSGQVSADVIAYRATSDNIGSWGIDVIQNLCPTSGSSSSFTWNVLGFDSNAQWTATRF